MSSLQGGVGVATALTQISGYAHVAERYGFEEAVFLDSIVYWYRTNRANNRNFRDGRWWTYNSIKAFEEIFPWWSAKQIRRIANSCRDQGALIAGEYNEDRRDRSLWYAPGDELLSLYGLAKTGKCTCPNGQMQAPKGADECAQMGKCIYGIPCINHECTYMTPYSPPSQPEADGTGDGAVSEPEPVDKPGRKTRRGRFVPPDVEQVRAYCRERGNSIEPQTFVDYYASKGWVVGRSPMKDWKAAVRTWEQRRNAQPQGSSGRVKDLEVL